MLVRLALLAGVAGLLVGVGLRAAGVRRPATLLGIAAAPWAAHLAWLTAQAWGRAGAGAALGFAAGGLALGALALAAARAGRARRRLLAALPLALGLAHAALPTLWLAARYRHAGATLDSIPTALLLAASLGAAALLLVALPAAPGRSGPPARRS